MEIIVRNLPDQSTEKQVEQFFRPLLASLNINTFSCRRLKGRGLATITIADVTKAQEFLSLHGQTAPGPEAFGRVQKKLYHMKRPINCSQSRNNPDPYLLRSLEKDEKDKKTDPSRKAKLAPSRPRDLQRRYDIKSIDCGQWDYMDGRLVFASQFQEQKEGIMVFGKQSLRIDLHPAYITMPGHRLEISYGSVESFTTGSAPNPTVTFSLAEPPKILEDLDTLSAKMSNLALKKQETAMIRKRSQALNKAHEKVVSSCMCYRVALSKSSDISRIQALKRLTEIPQSIFWDTYSVLRNDFPDQLTLLNNALSGDMFDHISFEVKFQFQRLAQNGYLPATRVVELLILVAQNIDDVDDSTLITAVRKLSHQIPYPGPSTDSSELDAMALIKLLKEHVQSIEREGNYSAGIVEEYDHLALIHKAAVTPTGIILSGPETEIKNRVLRKYSSFSNYFLQVSFLDEDMEPLRYNRYVSNDDVYQKRFKKVLDGIIFIAGRGYEFLGFSHSSLRSQTCWFMAPFTLNGEMLYARLVISRLGTFSDIRSPAKCAARIGQAFSQTFSSITLPDTAIKSIPDVERNGRNFSDGVGTCSETIMRMIWKEYSQSRDLKPTVFQIRFAGAKGMISLDTRLEGDVLCLRDSMVKFKAVEKNIEICGAGLRPLPMYLNRQLIKILEDLRVKDEAFLKLQAIAVDTLRSTTQSPVNAANFLQRNFIGKAARLPWLIRKLLDLNILFNDDMFLRNTLELAILVQLRELKHRSRIYVEDGMTLYGIMDETDFLEEGEVYCTVHREHGPLVLTGSVVVTRSPALHPGDVQCVKAVDVPQDSPLRALHNCLVFSSKGERDLPSKLSGGDLDGDLYNVIYDASLYPEVIALPADYAIQAPINILREVVKSDMTAFFIMFMENDQLGRIATLHQNLADQKPSGTFDPECVLLAELHSTAVDFSKTGIPADLSKMPRHSNVKPDFQAPGPRVLIEENINLEEDSDDDDYDNKDENDEESMPRVRYYESHKILGKLYRAIDEHRIFEQIQRDSRLPKAALMTDKNILNSVLKYVQKSTALIQFSHYIEFANDVKEAYEENLSTTMLTYSTHPNHFVSEVEVFCGSILGKNGAQSKRQRESSVSMKDKHERDVAYTVACITQGDQNDNRAEALERSIACLTVACSPARARRKVGSLVSFGWVAAAVCLREVEKFQGI